MVCKMKTLIKRLFRGVNSTRHSHTELLGERVGESRSQRKEQVKTNGKIKVIEEMNKNIPRINESKG
jgi:hypothetical protein